MTSQIEPRTTLLATFDVPRIVAGAPGRQDRSIDGRLRIVPGAACPLEIAWVDPNGTPINLRSMVPKISFFLIRKFEGRPDHAVPGDLPEMIFSVPMSVVDPFSGLCFVLLSGSETAVLGARSAYGPVRWATFLYSSIEDELYAATVEANAGYSGPVVVERGLPPIESVRGS